jgi:hypothetical protein
MKYALIEPQMPYETGFVITCVNPNSFEVCPPLYWVECDDNIIAYQYWYDPITQIISEIPLPPPIEPIEPENII